MKACSGNGSPIIAVVRVANTSGVSGTFACAIVTKLHKHIYTARPAVGSLDEQNSLGSLLKVLNKDKLHICVSVI